MPEMVENCRSIGPATDAAMVSGLAPGRVAVTWMVGKSTRGSAATASSLYANTPNTMIEAVMSVVITGRRMHVSDRFMSGTDVVALRHPSALRQQQLAIGHDHLTLLEPG